MNVQDNHTMVSSSWNLKGKKKLVLNDRCQSQTLLPFGRTRKLAKRGSVVSVSSSQAISRFSIRRWLLYFWAGHAPMARAALQSPTFACFARSYVWASPSNNSRLPFWKWKREKAMSPKLLGALQQKHAVVASKLHGRKPLPPPPCVLLV